MRSTFKEGIELIRKEWKTAALGAIVTLLVGLISSIITGGFDAYGELIRPPFSPPSAVFPIVWTILYTIIGASAALLSKSMCQSSDKDKATLLYVTMLLFNFLWSPLFFGLEAYYAAIVDLVIIIVLTAVMLPYYRKCFVPGLFAMAAYLVWLIYALYLNIGTTLLN